MEILAYSLLFLTIVSIIVSIYITFKRRKKVRYINKKMNKEIEEYIIGLIKQKHVINTKELRKDVWRYIMYKYPDEYKQVSDSYVSKREYKLNKQDKIEKMNTLSTKKEVIMLSNKEIDRKINRQHLPFNI